MRNSRTHGTKKAGGSPAFFEIRLRSIVLATLVPSIGMTGAFRRKHFLCLQTFRPIFYYERHFLAFLERSKTAALDRLEVHEQVTAVVAADEPVSLGIVKPLDCARCTFFRHDLPHPFKR